jgi:O-antigen/teichoic acid export membrane protein
MTDARRTLRNAGLLMAQRVFHIVGATLFAAIVPRLFGPAQFGRFALLTSVSMWFALLSGLGAVSMMTRSIPRFKAASDDEGLRRLATSLVVLRAATGAVTATGYFLVATVVVGEPDLVAAAFVAGAVFSRTVGNLGFALFLGLNDAARWGMGDLIRRWMTLALVPIGFIAAGLRGACLGLLGAEMAVLACGIWWARPYLSLSSLDLSRRHLSPFLRMGGLFAAGNLLLALTQRSGETLVRFATGSWEQVGFFGAAFAVYLTVAHAFWQLTVSMAPVLITYLEQGRRDAVMSWIERLLKYLVATVVLCVAGAALVGRDLVPMLMGAKFATVATNVTVLTLTLLTMSVGSVGRLAALTLDRPRVIIVAAGLELAAFWLLGFPLATRFGSLGACIAALPASALYAWYLTTRVRPDLPYSIGPAARALAASLVFVPLVLLRPAWPLNALVFTAGAAAYLGLLLRLRVITVAEIAETKRTLSAERPSAAPAA